MILGLTIMTQAQAASTGPAREHLSVRSDQVSDLQRLIDDKVSQGYRVSGISYHTSMMNLNSKGRLEVDFEPAGARGRYEYRALITEFEASALEKALNEGGSKGFRLLKQTPIPVELGLIRPRDMFLAVMEKTAGSYAYRVVAYRRLPRVRQSVKQAQAEGFVKACDTQFGPVTYLVMEKTTNRAE